MSNLKVDYLYRPQEKWNPERETFSKGCLTSLQMAGIKKLKFELFENLKIWDPIFGKETFISQNGDKQPILKFDRQYNALRRYCVAPINMDLDLRWVCERWNRPKKSDRLEQY
jgi:hypothetical protein